MKENWPSDCDQRESYIRQGAQDLYNRTYCENIVNDKQEKRVTKITDSMSIMYK